MSLDEIALSVDARKDRHTAEAKAFDILQYEVTGVDVDGITTMSTQKYTRCLAVNSNGAYLATEDQVRFSLPRGRAEYG